MNTPNTCNNYFWRDTQKWKKASMNTLICLIGCSIGDLGMLVFFQATQVKISLAASMVIEMAAGLITSIWLETIILKFKQGFSWLESLKTAFSMSILSMLAMELTENLTDYWLTGGKVPISDPYYWIALLISMGAAFIVPLPYNYYKLKKHNQSCH